MEKIQALLWMLMVSAVGTLPALAGTTSSTISTALIQNTSSIARSAVTITQDAAITTYIYAKLAIKPSLMQSKIDISTNDGNVTIYGIVNDTQQVTEITKVAKSTTGVKSVDCSKMIIAQLSNDLYLKPAVNSGSQIKIQETRPAVATPLTSEDPILTAPEAIAAEKREALSAPKEHIMTAMLSTQKHPQRSQQMQISAKKKSSHCKKHSSQKKLKKHLKKRHPVKHPQKSKACKNSVKR